MHQCPADEKFGDLYSFDHDDSASFLKTNAVSNQKQTVCNTLSADIQKSTVEYFDSIFTDLRILSQDMCIFIYLEICISLIGATRFENFNSISNKILVCGQLSHNWSSYFVQSISWRDFKIV